MYIYPLSSVSACPFLSYFQIVFLPLCFCFFLKMTLPDVSNQSSLKGFFPLYKTLLSGKEKIFVACSKITDFLWLKDDRIYWRDDQASCGVSEKAPQDGAA
jgi:hypothetical protein